MPTYSRDDVTIHYTLGGDPEGFPVLLVAPGGLRSEAARWANVPWNPLARLRGYRLIAMDQRNAGGSRAPITASDGWDTYTADQLALLDHLGVEQFHAVGMCIGGPYVMGLIRAAPQRVRSAVLLQPIGLRDNREAFLELFDQWAAELAPAHPEADAAAWAAFRSAMFGGDFLFDASREEAAACPVPVLLLMGDDRYHPAEISRELAGLLPDVEVVERWKEGPALEAADRTIAAFLARHTP